MIIWFLLINNKAKLKFNFIFLYHLFVVSLYCQIKHIIMKTRTKKINFKGTKFESVNKDMNDDVYKLRSQVMKYIYDAKKLVKTELNVELPRQTIRIVDMTPMGADSLLGFATMGKNSVFIPEKTLSKEYNLKQIVFHEILHSWLRIEHDEKSKLMSAFLTAKMTDKQINSEFINFIKKALK